MPDQPQDPAALLDRDFASVPVILNGWAAVQPEAPAVADDDERLNWRDFVALANRMAARFQADGLQRGQAVAILGTTCVRYAAAYWGAILAGGCAAPLTTSSTPAQLAAMLANSGAMHLVIDAAKRADLEGTQLPQGVTMLAMDGPDRDGWLAPEGALPAAFEPRESDPFNIIYSSGTTGTPKGIVHSHVMRWRQFSGAQKVAYHRNGRALLSTPLYSNTTMAVFLPTMMHGGCARLMGKFDVARWLEIAEAERITHTMLVPVQYQRLLAHPGFDAADLSAMEHKYCTSAPFSAALKADALKRFPGTLTEIYGMTEGGLVCTLQAHNFPDKLHTVGRPVPGHELKVIDEDGNELPPGSKGELVGRSATMMLGYQNQPEKTAAMQWRDADGQLWFRMGDVGIVDEDGFVSIVGRTKDMIISGGFNIYPIDLEAELVADPDVVEAAVVGIASEQWGETPVGFVVLRAGAARDLDAVLADTNARLGKTQRLSALHAIDEMPRSHIGKLLKTELRELAMAMQPAPQVA